MRRSTVTATAVVALAVSLFTVSIGLAERDVELLIGGAAVAAIMAWVIVMYDRVSQP